MHLITARGSAAGIGSCASAGVNDCGWGLAGDDGESVPGFERVRVETNQSQTGRFVYVRVVSNNFLDGVVAAHAEFLRGNCLYTNSAVRSAIAQLHGDMARCVLQGFQDARHGLSIDLANGPAQAYTGLDRTLLVENGCAHATRSKIVFLIVNGVALSAYFFQFLEKTRHGGDGLRSAFFHGPLSNYFFESVLRNVSHQGFSHAGGMNAHAATDPGVHADESRGLYFLDVDGLGSIQNREMAGKAGLFHQVSHDGQRNLAHVDAAEGAATQAQNLQSNAVLAAWRLPIQVALGFERAQDVTGGTLWNLKLAADLGIAEAFGFVGNRFQHGKRSLDRNRRRFALGIHR